MTESQTPVLVIEDDDDIRLLLRAILARESYAVTEAMTGRDGLRKFHDTRPGVVILDIGLPDLDGWQILERIREMSDIPVLVLTARSTDRDKVRGFDAGADDYLTKPFSRMELLARLHAIQRRHGARRAEVARFDDGVVAVDFTHRQVALRGVPVAVTPSEYRLLEALVRHPGQVLSADQLVQLAWKDDSGSTSERVKYTVLRLRRKLAATALGDGASTLDPLAGSEGADDSESADTDEGSMIQTVRGFGYRYRSSTG